jgi:hypothetical protein
VNVEGAISPRNQEAYPLEFLHTSIHTVVVYVVKILHGIMNKSLIIHEKNTREITAIAQV